MDRWAGERKDGWDGMDGWMDGWMDGRSGGRTDERTEIDFITGTATITLFAGGTQS